MAQKILTSSLESATLTITNGGNSNLKLLKNRDRRVKGLNTTTSGIAALHIVFSSSTTVNVTSLMGMTSDKDVSIGFYYGVGATLDGTLSAVTYDNNDVWYEWASSRSNTDFYIYFNKDTAASATMECGSIFFGVSHNYTNNYDYNNTRNSFMNNVKTVDDYGYPYSYLLNADKKFNFDLTWGMTKSDLSSLEDELVGCGYSAKPFVYYDSNIASEKSATFSTCYLVKLPDTNSIQTYQPGADYFKVRMNMQQL